MSVLTQAQQRREALEHGPPARRPVQSWDELTPRQQEFARLFASGALNKEIAASLSVSLENVKNFHTILCGRTGARNRTELARWVWVQTEFPDVIERTRAQTRAELRAELAPLWRQAAARLRDLRYEIHDGVPYVRRKAAVAVVIGVLAEALDQPPHAAPE